MLELILIHVQDTLSLERILPTLKNSTSLSAKILWRLLAFQTATAPSATKDFSGGMPQEIMLRAFTSLECSSTIVMFVGRKLYLKMLLLITCQQLIIKKIPYNYQISPAHIFLKVSNLPQSRCLLTSVF